MDHSGSGEQDADIDLESGVGAIHSNEEGSLNPGLDEKLAETIFLKLSDRYISVDDSSVKPGSNPNEGSPENNVLMEGETVGNSLGKKMDQEKRKKAKKPPRPPRPPKGFSFDASDQKLIKELAELAMIKRARIERMKALKLKKSLKISSSSSSSHGSLFAMLFTIIFFLVILLQGRNSGANFQGSPQTNENGSIFVQAQLNPSASESISPIPKSSTLF
ncbi:uncharacterized protein LOC112521253 [Cynara cardunculus var. scolymus]|uniref:Transmembrane protein n=1 Tax=Cynara cardunculus var. scolymus TaxID=59895 RepID=A0A103XGB2_CYNCS|nr:uncharacterized protein LOC112521253 [Cynara cardunculus var. scolymus]XP_024985772.1 uncharacterized protein LOC112521253 [Cynara cardunculus var. scolymus]XP_024985773.1 uncharacterized protein LOC112521253 [Cynara cardunculus var. scolymus]XP_024985774.1 uncharacterized protein LOC112521253 [Cynara cardunculus var. scolymus]KVH90196.1 hypothetical protein Ccrd_007787 [Cynara cardunculus var. scolymus]